MKNMWNPVNIPWIYSQDFHGFSFHSAICATNSQPRPESMVQRSKYMYLQCTKLKVNCKQQNINLPLLKPTIRRPAISNDGALAWYEKNIIIEPNRAGRLFNNRVLLLKRKITNHFINIGSQMCNNNHSISECVKEKPSRLHKKVTATKETIISKLEARAKESGKEQKALRGYMYHDYIFCASGDLNSQPKQKVVYTCRPLSPRHPLCSPYK